MILPMTLPTSGASFWAISLSSYAYILIYRHSQALKSFRSLFPLNTEPDVEGDATVDALVTEVATILTLILDGDPHTAEYLSWLNERL